MKRGKTAYAISLDEFIHESYLTYREYCRENGDACIRSAIPKFFKDFCPKNHFRGTRVVSDNPYIGLNDRSYWSRSISRVDASDVDPVGIPKFRISSYDKIGSAGSCFAQHISNAVASAGYNYFVTETGKDRCGVVDRSLQYGVYSARYGNIYTAKQLLQLFDRSFGHFSPIDQYWETRKGRFVDPFRATVEPGGFPCVRELLEDRERHFECTRRLFKELDVFVFTLGLTECWVSAIDGAVYSVAPGVEAGSFSHNDHQFLNLGFEEILSDLIAFRERLKSVNPRAKLLLTVSPVALVATYSQNHVLVANTYSKSVLRSVASVFAESYPDVDYFPSYEIVLGQHNDGKYLDKDRRRIREEGVMRVFDLLLKHYFVDSKNDLKDSVSMAEIVCDEELLDNDR